MTVPPVPTTVRVIGLNGVADTEDVDPVEVAVAVTVPTCASRPDCVAVSYIIHSFPEKDAPTVFEDRGQEKVRFAITPEMRVTLPGAVNLLGTPDMLEQFRPVRVIVLPSSPTCAVRIPFALREGFLHAYGSAERHDVGSEGEKSLS